MRCKVPACMLKLIRMTLNHKHWAVFLIMSFIAIIFYWRIAQNANSKRPVYTLPIEVQCPPSPPTLISRWSSQSPKDIYFLETSERTSPNFLFMCSDESAARIHPESRILVLMKGLAKHNLTLPKHLGISLLSCFHNLEFRQLDPNDLFLDTPLAVWYSQAQQRWEPYFLNNLSNACRLAILWKFGGIYLDTDFIVLKNLNNLTNALSKESKYLLNGAFLSFEPKHRFIELCMQSFVADYRGWTWGHQCPKLVTRVFKNWCSVTSLQSGTSCRGITILPQEAFYPIPWEDWKKYFEAVSASELPNLFKNTYAAHTWNKESQGTRFDITSKALLAHLYSQRCPSTYSLMKTYQDSDMA